MPNWVSLKDLMENPSKYEVQDPRLLEIAYTPDNQRIVLPSHMTGYNVAQAFKTDTKLHKYYPVIYEMKMYLVSSTTTNQVVLCGKIGHDNIEQTLNLHSQLWRNNQLGTAGEIWNKKTIGIINMLPENLRKTQRAYWTAIKNSHDKHFDVAYVDLEGLTRWDLYCYRRGSRVIYSRSSAVRPLISLLPETQVDIEKLVGIPLKLKLP